MFATLLKIVKSKRFWVMALTFVVNAVNYVHPMLSGTVVVVLDSVSAVAMTVLTAISPTTSSVAAPTTPAN
jgi:hypothetical protein